MLCVEGVPGLPGAPQDDAGLTRKFEMSHVGGATCRMTRLLSREDRLNSMASGVLQEPGILKGWGGGGRLRFEPTWACWLL